MGQTQYAEIEMKVLKTVLGLPDFTRWASLCSLMSDGIYIAAETYDRDLPKRGWLHICARYLAIVPKRENRDKRLAPNEFLAEESSPYCDVFRQVVRSLHHYMETIYPNFDSKTGKWSQAGKEDRCDNPFPFFISDYLTAYEDEDDDVVTFCTLFEPISEDCGEVLRWTPEFNEELARITDDYDADLEFGYFAGNVDENGIKKIVKNIDELESGGVSTEHYSMRKALKSGSLHDPATTISYGYAGGKEEERSAGMRNGNGSNVIQIKDCGNVQVSNGNSFGAQSFGSISKSDKKGWTYWLLSIIGAVIAGLIVAYVKMFL